MKRFILSVAILGLCATMNFTNAQSVNAKADKIPFSVEIARLSSYLDLSPNQHDRVYDINNYFVQLQQSVLSDDDASRQKDKLQRAVDANLKMMRETLNDGQYEKYVALLQLTNSNNRKIGSIALDEVYLAENN